ncbi:MAG: carboxy-S-adenosyl-L-methionine synthase CmoA [Rhodospirillales bacterium]
MTKDKNKKADTVHIIPVGDGDGDAHHRQRDDKLFAEKRSLVRDFEFNDKTAAVFDDMVDRSIPFYDEIQRMVGELARDFALPGTNLYDLGCSTGTTFLVLDDFLAPGVCFIGVDNSEDMLVKARRKLRTVQSKRTLELINADLDTNPEIENASVVILLLTLQFLRPLKREKFLRHIFAGMRENACLILVEKLTCEYTLFNRLFINHYYEFKRRNNYSDLEIAQKREALENVLIPYRSEENHALLASIGFRHMEEFFRWYNFSGLVAVK